MQMKEASDSNQAPSRKSTHSSLEEKQLRETIISTLQDIYDPEIPVNIYALGLIYKIEIFPINNIQITMTLTSPNCPVAESLPKEVRDRVLALDKVNEVEIVLTFEPPYTQDMMSEEAKLVLGLL